MITLLTHENELRKYSNTGRLVLESIPTLARRCLWRRTVPDEQLLATIETAQVALLHPEGDAVPVASQGAYDHFIVIDSTWQEARKIINRSTYLHDIPRVALPTGSPSRFTLRRNQVAGGLSTVESVIALLKAQQYDHVAEQLEQNFLAWLAIHQAPKSSRSNDQELS